MGVVGVVRTPHLRQTQEISNEKSALYGTHTGQTQKISNENQ